MTGAADDSTVPHTVKISSLHSAYRLILGGLHLLHTQSCQSHTLHPSTNTEGHFQKQAIRVQGRRLIQRLSTRLFLRPKTRVPDNLMQGTTGGGGSGKCRMTSISLLVVEWWDAPRQSPFRNDLVETWRATRHYETQTPRILNPPKGSYFLHLGLEYGSMGRTRLRLYDSIRGPPVETLLNFPSMTFHQRS